MVVATAAKPHHVEDFAELVVRDFLQAKGYNATLNVLNQEKRGHVRTPSI